MPAGSVWEVYIPQQLASGEREQGQIKPFSVLIFKIELISVGGK
jgi:FKBP-type peptidyl-prolyl cis-trans isomerase FklB